MQLDIITPEKNLYSSDVEMVTIPGTLGDFGVLNGHAPFISTIRPGVITIDGGGAQKRLVVMSGLAEVVPERCIILAENVIDCSELTTEMVQSRIEHAQDEWDDATSDSAKKIADTKRQFAEVLRQNVA